MLPFLLFAGLAVASSTPQEDALHRIALPDRRIYTRSTNEVDGLAFLSALQQSLNKYRSVSNVTGAALSARLQPRLAIENLLDQVGGGDFDEEYYGPMQVGSGSTEQVFTVVFDTGSADIFIPGPQCTSNAGCPYNIHYNEGGTSKHRTTTVDYGSGFIEGNDYTDTINIAGLTATNQGFISLTQAEGFNTSAAEGLLGMAFTSLAASGFTTFFENLMAQDRVAAPEFSFYLGRAASGTSHRGSLCLGCQDSSRYTGSFTQVPVTAAAYWQIALDAVNVNGVSAGPISKGQAMIDTGTTLILAPRAAAKAIFELIPGAFPLFGDDYSDQTFFAYPCSMPSNYMPALQFAGKSFGINSLDFNFGVLTSAFARLIGNETMAIELEIEVESGAAKTELETGDLTEASCVAAIVGTDVDPQENLYVVGDAFLKNWYSTFNYVNANGGPSVSFAAAI